MCKTYWEEQWSIYNKYRNYVTSEIATFTPGLQALLVIARNTNYSIEITWIYLQHASTCLGTVGKRSNITGSWFFLKAAFSCMGQFHMLNVYLIAEDPVWNMNISHQWDVWHGAKNLGKKLQAVCIVISLSMVIHSICMV